MMKSVCRQRTKETCDATDKRREDDRYCAEAVLRVGAVEAEDEKTTGNCAAESADGPTPQKRTLRNKEVERQQCDNPRSKDECGRVGRNKSDTDKPLVRYGRIRAMLGSCDEGPDQEKCVESEPTDKCK